MIRAVVVDEFGGREKMHLADVPEQKLGADSVLIRLKATSANPVDYKTREGKQKDAFPHLFPLVLGHDAAGIVEKVGPAANGVEVGPNRGHGGRWTLAALAVADIAFAFQQTAVVPAIPAVQRDLHASQAWSAWLLTGYLVGRDTAARQARRPPRSPPGARWLTRRLPRRLDRRRTRSEPHRPHRLPLGAGDRRRRLPADALARPRRVSAGSSTRLGCM